ncbi:hypothetical protein [Paenibacillus glycanilyticus]|uniref:Uncharacterized protein n=1 Tax=Paenibacillus glycanilyticus TaxID=126569 RepID=A0ABQ6GE85_9BACL|nr:hypothetical protein [Paenibacillus glycanilyticus]GLX69279.1 hypothetical protein MU1_36240 [Paenibacillus glycanilyticus]
MAIYTPPSFCGLHAVLKLKQDLIWNETFIRQGEICEAVDMIGYTYVIQTTGNETHIQHRMKNSIMGDYFDIVDGGVKDWIDDTVKETYSCKAVQIKDLTIRVSKNESFVIPKGSEFYCVKDESDVNTYWDLYEVASLERVLRLKHEEFLEHMEVMREG